MSISKFKRKPSGLYYVANELIKNKVNIFKDTIIIPMKGLGKKVE